MIYYLVDTLLEVFKWLVMPRQCELYVQISYFFKRLYVLAERVLNGLRVYADVWCNFGEDMVAGKQYFFIGFIKADVTGGMTGRPYDAEGERAMFDYITVMEDYIGIGWRDIMFQPYGRVS